MLVAQKDTGLDLAIQVNLLRSIQGEEIGREKFIRAQFILHISVSMINIFLLLTGIKQIWLNGNTVSLAIGMDVQKVHCPRVQKRENFYRAIPWNLLKLWLSLL
jgi:hypothetical protein